MESEIIKTLAGQGILGVILIWFMFRLEKKLSDNTKSNNNISLVLLHMVDAVSNCPNNSSNGGTIKKQQIEKLKEDILST